MITQTNVFIYNITSQENSSTIVLQHTCIPTTYV